jgi:acetyl esterase/lipase
VTIRQDVSFLAPDRGEKLDLYLPSTRPASTRSPAIVIIHGGGWVGGDKAASREFKTATTFVEHGYVCVSINYLLGKGSWPTNLLDCKNAVRFLRSRADELQIDPDRIGVIGGSAGGHLALMVAYTADVAELEPPQPYPGVSSRVSCVVDLYGITNLLTRHKTDPTGKPLSATTKAAAMLEYDEAKWRAASPVTYVSPKTVPTLILQGLADTTVDRDQSFELADKLTQAGVEHELITLEGIGHTFDLQTWNRKPLPRDLRPVVVEFFDRHLKRR